MIEWLARVDPDRLFLQTAERAWTYGETCAEVLSRLQPDPVVVTPNLTPASVFVILAGLTEGGLTVVGDGQSAKPAPGVELVVFTSGSSGQAKGVRLTKANLEAASRASVEHLGHGPDDTWLLAMPLFHVGGLSIVVRSVFAGGSVRLVDSFEPRVFANAMREVTMVSVVATMLGRVLEVDSGPYHGLRAVLVGGGPIPNGLLERAVDAGIPALPSYGMTETFGQVATLRPGSNPTRRAHPLPGVEIRVDTNGVIQIRSPQVSPGYVGEPDRVDEWFTTSDLGEIDADGALRVLGRADDVIVTGGKNVDPNQVEEQILVYPGVTEAVVYGIADDQWGERVVAAVVGEVVPDQLLAFLKERLPAFMVPKEVRLRRSLPRTAIGKPDRRSAELRRGG